jgi:formate/nitrite transporter FocA (FNT family)
MFPQVSVKYIKLLVSSSEFVNSIKTSAKLNATAATKLITPVGNFMYFTVGLYYRVISPTRVLKIFMLCFIGNALGGLVFFLILKGSDV